MGGKKKSTNDEGLGKTARASALKKGGKQEGFHAAASTDMNRIIPLGGGSHAYLLDPRNGKTHHLRVGSDRWNELIVELYETPHASQIQAELANLGWV